MGPDAAVRLPQNDPLLDFPETYHYASMKNLMIEV